MTVGSSYLFSALHVRFQTPGFVAATVSMWYHGQIAQQPLWGAVGNTTS